MARSIPVSEPIPHGYRRHFYFEEGQFRASIFITHERGLRLVSTGKETPQSKSHCMDWIEESIAMIRAELQELAKG